VCVNRRSAVSTESTLFLIGCGWRLLARLPPAQHLTAGKDPRDVNTRPRPHHEFRDVFGLAQHDAVPDHRTKKDLEICGCVRAAIVPFAPGGLTDVIGRVLAEGMRTTLGRPVIVENVGGANGSIGTGRVARAASDGYTLVVGIWNTHVANGATYVLQYDVAKDFEPIVLLADAPLLLVAYRRMI
jgi:hypothetical protein